MSWNIDLPKAQYIGHQTSADVLQRTINEVYNSEIVGIDSETTGLVKWKDIPLYWSIAWGHQRATVHADMLPYFTPCFQNDKTIWALANAKYDMHMFANLGHYIRGRWHDVQVMHALLFDDKPHKLKYIAQHILNWTWADFQDQFGKISAKQSPQQLIQRAERENFSLLVEYASNDAWGTLKAYEVLRSMLMREATFSLFRDKPPYIETLWDFFCKIEAPYTKTLWKMERRGIKVDRGRFAAARPEAEKKIAEIERDITRLAGSTINPNSPVQVAAYANSVGIKPLKWTKGGKSGERKASWDADTLEHYRNDVPVFGLILDHRAYSKLLGTYIIGLHELLDPFDRIHSNFNQDVARCMPAGELVLTNRGYIPVETVKKGDLVLSHTGTPRKVTATSKHAPAPIYKVTLDNGMTLRTNGQHPYLSGNDWVPAECLGLGHVVRVYGDAEHWGVIPQWSDYQVSSWGRVRTTEGQILKQTTKDKYGHLKVTLTRNGAQDRRKGNRKDISVHRLVAATFSPTDSNSNKNVLVRHLNGIAWDNNHCNLLFGTVQENIKDAQEHGTMHGAPKLSKEDVDYIRRVATLGQAANPASKLSYEKAQQIRELYASGDVGRAELARMYGVPFQSVDSIIKDKTWVVPRAGLSAEELGERFGVSAGCIRDIWAKRRWSKEEENAEKVPVVVFTTATVVSVEIEEPQVTYGLTVEVDHSHVTGGIVTHNTGRLSSSDPNLQNIPRPENDHWNLRGAFVTDPGWKVLAADYSQLEMRLLAAAAQEKSMADIFMRGWDIHAGNAALMFDLEYTDVDASKDVLKKIGKLTPEDALHEAESKLPGIQQRAYAHNVSVEAYLRECAACRSAAKSIGFGLNYGMGPGKLANSLGISVDDAKAKITQYKSTYPAVEAFMAEAVEEGRKYGFAFTIMGRRRNIPMIASSNKGEQALGERLAVNTQIQGSAADVTRMAQVAIDTCGLDRVYGCYNTLQVHDELVFECPAETIMAARDEIEELMAHPFSEDLMCPLVAEAGIGDSWGEAK